MSHENTITIQHKGKWHNIPTVIKGRQLTDAGAKANAVRNKSLGKAFDKVNAAVAAAKKRSASFDKKK